VIKSDQKRNSKHESKIRRALKEKSENKGMHGQYVRSIDRELIGEEDTLLYLKVK
jgi:hypothetical protein